MNTRARRVPLRLCGALFALVTLLVGAVLPAKSTPAAWALHVAVRQRDAPAHHRSTRSPAHVSCARHPSACGYPDATDTGPVTRTRLRKVPDQVRSGRGWTYDDEEGVVVTGKGAVLSDLDIVDNGVEIKADDVTVSNVRITESGDWWGIGLYHANHATIEHTLITSPHARGPRRLEVGIKDIYGDAVGTRVLSDDISHTSTGVQLSSGLIHNNYIHGMGYKLGDHLNGTTSNGGDLHRLVITHNTVLNNFGQADAISLFEDFGAQHNALIDHNLVAGGSYSIYGGANARGRPTRNIKIVHNRFSTRYFRRSGAFGPIAAFDPRGHRNLWADNRWIDGPRAGKLIGPHGQTRR